MENQSKYIMIERNKFAALVKAHLKFILCHFNELYFHSGIRRQFLYPGSSACSENNRHKECMFRFS